MNMTLLYQREIHHSLRYPLVNVYVPMEIHHFSWDNSLFQWAMFNGKLFYILPEVIDWHGKIPWSPTLAVAAQLRSCCLVGFGTSLPAGFMACCVPLQRAGSVSDLPQASAECSWILMILWRCTANCGHLQNTLQINIYYEDVLQVSLS